MVCYHYSIKEVIGMEYDIKPYWNVDVDAVDESRLVQAERLEETLAWTLPSKAVVTMVECDLRANLSIPLKAEVLRNLGPGQEVVRLTSGKKHVDLIRGKDIDVSCDPQGDRVLVRTINIHFLDDHGNDLTDRGVVWVFPGNPASMHFTIKKQALETSGKTTEIVQAAEEAVRNKVLAHFT